MSATFVVTADAAAAELSRVAGARVLWDHVPPRGMNPAVAIGQSEVEDRLMDAALVLTADLPLVRSEDLEAIVAALRPGRGAVLVPSRDGTGTNALALAPPFGIATRLGANSRALHEYALANAGIELSRLTCRRWRWTSIPPMTCWRWRCATTTVVRGCAVPAGAWPTGSVQGWSAEAVRP